MLLGQGITLPKHTEAEFTVVLFEENAEIAKKAIIHEYHSNLQRDHQLARLDLNRKIRTLKL